MQAHSPALGSMSWILFTSSPNVSASKNLLRHCRAEISLREQIVDLIEVEQAPNNVVLMGEASRGSLDSGLQSTLDAVCDPGLRKPNAGWF